MHAEEVSSSVELTGLVEAVERSWQQLGTSDHLVVMLPCSCFVNVTRTSSLQTTRIGHGYLVTSQPDGLLRRLHRTSGSREASVLATGRLRLTYLMASYVLENFTTLTYLFKAFSSLNFVTSQSSSWWHCHLSTDLLERWPCYQEFKYYNKVIKERNGCSEGKWAAAIEHAMKCSVRLWSVGSQSHDSFEASYEVNQVEDHQLTHHASSNLFVSFHPLTSYLS